MKYTTKPLLTLFILMVPIMGAIICRVASATDRQTQANVKVVTAAPPRTAMKLLSARKIWDKGKHNAFTDLIDFDGRIYCVFREGDRHVSPDGKIRILVSRDFKTWESSGLIGRKGMDLRDAKISLMPDGRLMIIGGAAPRKARESVATGSFVSFSKDGTSWTAPKLVGDPKRWIWRVTWRQGKGYAVDYSSGKTALLVTTDGLEYKTLLSPMCNKGAPNEATLRFTKDRTLYCLQRRAGSALIGRSQAPYKTWTWRNLGRYVGGPNMIRLPNGTWIGAGRFLKPKTHTALFALDADTGKIGEMLKLPSGGDTSYPGLLWRDGVLWVSYYSSHEGKTSIYIASVKISSAPSGE
jgi:hypothetical protein